MKPLNEPKLEARLNEYGQIDVEFYIARAKKARSQAIGQHLSALVKFFKKPAQAATQAKAA